MTDETSEPNIGAADEGKVELRRKRRWLRWILYALLAFVLLGSGTLVGLRFYYNDEFIRTEIQKRVSKVIDGKFEIQKLELSILQGHAEVYGVTYSAESTPKDMQALKLGRAMVDIDIVQSLLQRNFTAEMEVDGLEVNILRYPKPGAKPEDKEKYTTNIHDLLQQLTELPWKVWLSRINWFAAEGKFSISGSKITLSDAAKILKPCSFSNISAGLSRISDEAKFNASFNASSPQESKGTFVLQAATHISRNIDEDRPLDFLSELKVEGDFKGLDAAYISRYYGLGKKDVWIPGGPLDGGINFTAPQMSQLLGKIKLRTTNLVTLYQSDRKIAGAIPVALEADIDGDLSGRWTTLNPLKLNVVWGGKSAPALKALFTARGSLEKTLIFSADMEIDSTLIGHSPLGIVFGLQNSSKGKAAMHFMASWDRNAPWKLKLEAKSQDLVFFTPDNQEIPANLTVASEGTITHDQPFAVQGGTFSVNLNSDSMQIVTRKPVLMNFSNPQDFTGTVELRADMGKLYDRLTRVLKKWDIGRIDEDVSGSISRVADGGLEWALSMRQKGGKPSAILVRGGLNQKSGGVLAVRLNATCPDEGFSANITANGKIDKKIEFTQQVSTRVRGLHNILRRLVAPILKAKMPDGDYRGVFRQSGKGVYQKSAKGFDLSVALAAALEEADFPIAETRWREANARLSFSGYYRKSSSDNIVRVTGLQLRSQAANINANTSDVPLHLILQDWKKFLHQLPLANIAASVGADGFQRVAALCPEPAKSIINQGKSLQFSLSAEHNTGVVKLGTFDLRSKGINASIAGLQCSPAKIVDAVDARKYQDILKSISDFKLVASTSAELFNGLPLPPLWSFKGVGNLNAEYQAKGEKLKIVRLNFLEGARNQAVLQELALGGTVNHFSSLFNPASTPQDYLSTISQGINVRKLRISVPDLKKALGTENEANLRALTGQSITLTNAVFSPLSDNDYTLSGELDGAVSYYSKDAKWPLLSVDGTVYFPVQSPLRVRMTDGGVASAGSLDLSRARVVFNALNPYRYQKGHGQRCTLAYSMVHYNNGQIKVPQARISGGPLEVALAGFSFQPLQQGNFKLQLQQATIGTPLNTTIKDLLFDKTSDTIKAAVSTSGIDLSSLGSQLQFEHPLRITGHLGPSMVNFDDSYYRIMGGGAAVRPVNNSIRLGSLDILFSSADSQSKAELGFSVGGARTVPGEGTVVLEKIAIKKPQGYNYDNPVAIKQVQITPDMSTLFSDELLLNVLRVGELEAVYEMAFGTSNIGALQKNADELFPKGEGKPESQTRKTMIKDFYFAGGVVKLSQTLLMGKVSVPVPLPPFHTSNMGGGNPGSVFRTAFSLVFELIGKTGVGLVKNIGGTVTNVGKNVGKTILNPLERLLGRDKEKDNAGGQSAE